MTTSPSESIAGPGHPTPGDQRWRRVLVFHIGSLGDTVLTIPALQALRAHIGPEATVTLLHNAGGDDRVAPADIIPEGLIDERLPFAGPASEARGAGGGLRSVPTVVVAAVRRVGGAAVLLGRIRRPRFDAVVNLALSDRSARSLRRDRSFFRLAGIETIIGFDPEPPGRPEAEARLGRLQAAGIPAGLGEGPWLVPTGPARLEAERWRSVAGLAAGRAIVTIAPGTLMDAKRWPLDRWGALGSRLRGELGLEPVVVGGPADRGDGDRLVGIWGGGGNAAGALSPEGSAALMAAAALHIGVDTGTTHLAAAAGTAVVALYSHRAPIDQWAPLGGGHRIVHHPVPCAGCAAVVCPVAGHPCMTGIALDDVWSRVLATHGRQPQRSAARG